MPGADQEQSLRLAAFVDAGQVYAAEQKVELGELRYAVGLGAATGSRRSARCACRSPSR